MRDVIQLERRDDGVAVITLNNPKVNSLSTYMLRRLRTTVVGAAGRSARRGRRHRR